MQAATSDAPHSIIPADIQRRTMHNAFLQGLFWAMMFGVGECYFSIFATYIKAPSFYFGLMSGVPSLLGPLSQIVGANTVERTGKRKRIVNVSVILQGLCYLPMVYLPFLGPGESANYSLLAIMFVYFVGAHFCIPAWNSWISVIVPADERSSYFARNSRAVAVISLIAKLIVAGALYYAGRLAPEAQEATTAAIFAAGFALAGIARFGSYLFIQKMHEPEFVHSPDDSFTFWQFIRRARESNFVRFVLFVSLLHFGTLIAGPYFLPYAIYTLKFEQWQWVLLESFGAVASILTLLFWGSFSHRFGNRKALKYTSVVISVIPILWLLSVNFYFLLAVNIISGLAWAGFNLCTFNYILEAVSPAKRARCVAYFNCMVGIGIFAGSMLGGVLYEKIPTALVIADNVITVTSPFVYLLVLSAIARITMSALFVGAFNELRKVEPFSIKDLVFYIAEMRVPVGIRFGAIADPPKTETEGETIEKETLK